MTGGIVTLLALLGFLAVVVYVFVIKRGEDFDEQARQPLEDNDEGRQNNRQDNRRDNGDEKSRRSKQEGEEGRS